jgi:hypothetical protein
MRHGPKLHSYSTWSEVRSTNSFLLFSFLLTLYNPLNLFFLHLYLFFLSRHNDYNCFGFPAAINFSSPDLKIVPLCTCAKIIEVVGTKTRQIIHTLGNESIISTEIDSCLEEAKKSTSYNDNTNNPNNREFLLSICAYHRLFYQLVHYIICEHDELMTITAQKYYCNTDKTALTEKIQGARSYNSLPFEMEIESIGGLNLRSSSSNEDWSDIIFRLVSNLKWVSSLITLWSSYSN